MARSSLRSMSATFRSGGHGEVRGCVISAPFRRFRALWWPWLGARFGPFRRRFAPVATGRCGVWQIYVLCLCFQALWWPWLSAGFDPFWRRFALAAMGRCRLRSISAPLRRFRALWWLGARFGPLRLRFALVVTGSPEVWVSGHFCAISVFPGILVAIAGCSRRSMSALFRTGCGFRTISTPFQRVRGLWWPWLGGPFGPFRCHFALVATGRCAEFDSTMDDKTFSIQLAFTHSLCCTAFFPDHLISLETTISRSSS